MAIALRSADSTSMELTVIAQASARLDLLAGSEEPAAPGARQQPE
jgi:hypothetical protein